MGTSKTGGLGTVYIFFQGGNYPLAEFCVSSYTLFHIVVVGEKVKQPNSLIMDGFNVHGHLDPYLSFPRLYLPMFPCEVRIWVSIHVHRMLEYIRSPST